MTDDVVKWLVALLAVLVLLPILFMGLAMPMMGFGWGAGHMWNDGAWGGGALWLLMWLVVLIVLIGFAYVLFRGLSGAQNRSDRAMEELRTAYARGDLSDEEFENRRERLLQDRNE